MEHPRRQSTGTSVMPSFKPVGDETTMLSTNTAQTPKAPVVWPWIAVIILLLITAVSLVVAMVVGSNQPQPTPSPTVPSKTTTQSASPTPTNTAGNTVTLLLVDVSGKNFGEAANYVLGLGLKVETVAGDGLPSFDPRIQTVYDASPLGNNPITLRPNQRQRSKPQS
jgi:serine/threonine-protein kinase